MKLGKSLKRLKTKSQTNKTGDYAGENRAKETSDTGMEKSSPKEVDASLAVSIGRRYWRMSTVLQPN